jgi:hypothetical protein
MPELPVDSLNAYRARTYHMLPGMRLYSADDAVNFINGRGFIYFWPIQNVVMPSLWVAAAGDRPVPDEHDDPGHVTWGWKDSLLGQRRCYYARLLRHRNTFVSLETLPYFYALSPNYGDWENDYLDQYETGQLKLESRQLYEALLHEGALDTLALRRESHLTGDGSDTRFNRALDDLQFQMKILPIGVAEVGAWRYAFIYDITARYYSDLDARTRPISEEQAREKLLELYLASVGAIPLPAVGRLFSWRPLETQKAIKSLIHQDLILPGYALPGIKDEVIVYTGLVTSQ